MRVSTITLKQLRRISDAVGSHQENRKHLQVSTQRALIQKIGYTRFGELKEQTGDAEITQRQ